MVLISPANEYGSSLSLKLQYNHAYQFIFFANRPTKKKTQWEGECETGREESERGIVLKEMLNVMIILFIMIDFAYLCDSF